MAPPPQRGWDGDPCRNLGKFLRKECSKVLPVMCPLLARGIGQYSLNLISMHFVAGTASEHMPGTTLGMSLTTMLGWAAIAGQSTALCTLTAHAVGANSRCDGKDIAPDMFVNTAAFVHVAWALVPLACVPLMYSLLTAMGQDPYVVTDALRYFALSLVSLPFFAVFSSYRRYLEALMRPWPASLICICGVFFLSVLLDVVGTIAPAQLAPPIAMTVMFFTASVVLVRYVGPVRDFPSIPPRAAVYEYLHLAVPAMLSMMAEWWSSEILVVASGMLGRSSLTANAVCNTLLTFLYQVCYAIGTSCSVRVGFWLGAGHPKRAKQSLILHSLIGLVASAVVVAAIVTHRYSIARLLVGELDTETLELTASLIIPISRFYVLATWQASLYGTLCGAGLQKISFYNTLVSYWPLGIPLGLWLGFKRDLGVHGFWDGLLVGVCTNVALNLIYLFGVMDWNTVVDPDRMLAATKEVPTPAGDVGCSVDTTLRRLSPVRGGPSPASPTSSEEQSLLTKHNGYGTMMDEGPIP